MTHGDQPLPPRPEDRRPRPKASVAYSDRDPRLLETSAMGSLPDNKEGRDEGHEVGPGRSRGTSDERPGSDGNADLRPGPTATFCECPSETPASYIGGAPGGVYCDECDNPVRPKASAAKFGESDAGPDEASSIRQPDSPIQPSAATTEREEALRLSYMAESDLIEEYKLLRQTWERNPQLSAFASGVKAIRALRKVVDPDA